MKIPHPSTTQCFCVCQSELSEHAPAPEHGSTTGACTQEVLEKPAKRGRGVGECGACGRKESITYATSCRGRRSRVGGEPELRPGRQQAADSAKRRAPGHPAEPPRCFERLNLFVSKGWGLRELIPDALPAFLLTVPEQRNVRIMFEVDTLKYATLATVSRCGMVWFANDVVTQERLALRKPKQFKTRASEGRSGPLCSPLFALEVRILSGWSAATS